MRAPVFLEFNTRYISRQRRAVSTTFPRDRCDEVRVSEPSSNAWILGCKSNGVRESLSGVLAPVEMSKVVERRKQRRLRGTIQPATRWTEKLNSYEASG
jgi:hypothetical protein